MTPFWSDLDDMRWVESYITIPNKFFFFFIIFKKGSEIPGLFQQHKRTATVWMDLDGMGWRVTSLARFVFVISEDGK